MIILLLKSQADLFEKLVHVKGSVSKDGTVTKPHTAVRKVRREVVAPKRQAAQVTGDLFERASDEPPAPVKPAAKPRPIEERLERLQERRQGSAPKMAEPAQNPAPDAAQTQSQPDSEPAKASAPNPTETVDTTPDIPADRITGKVNYDGPFDPDTVPAFGVAAGTSKEARRQINATGAMLADQLRGNLTDADMATLRQYSGNGGCGDSLNEFYTDPKVAAAMWKVLHDNGLAGGDVLEPSCATGVFMETAPTGVRVQGVELDGVSAKIAALLHPAHGVSQSSLEGFATTDDRRFDAVIGNAPFGLRGGLLSQDKKDLKTAEAYFLDTSLDKTKPGGMVAMIVPTGVLDSKRDRKVRERLLRKAEFMGAMRMPNTAFEHSHTGVTTDVVFFRKRPDDVAGALSAVDQATLKKLGVWDDEFLAGSYFEERGAGNVLGTMEAGWRAKAGMGDDITVSGSMDGVPEAIAEFRPEASGPDLTVSAIIEVVPDEETREKVRGAAARRPYDTAKRGDTKMIDGVQYILEGQPLRWHRVDEFMATAAVTEAQDLASEIERALADDGYAEASGLADKVKAYVEAHGVPSKNPDLMLAASTDRSLYRLIGAVKPDGSISDLVSGRRSAALESSFDAAAATLALEQGSFKPSQVAARWAQGDSETVLDHLYASPEYALLPGDAGEWTSMDQYLSGEMWPALDAVRAALEGDLKPEDRAKFERQAQALEEAIDPKSLEDVELMLNSAFLPLKVVEEFFNEKKRAGAGWIANQPDLSIQFGDGIYTATGGTYDTKLLLKYLNRDGVRKDDDMPTIDRWNADFKAWLCGSAYRDEVEDLYNRSFRGFRQREYSNAPFDVPGLNAEGLKDYQWGGVRWALEAGKGIIAADVGLGKTARALILARMLKATGRAQRPIIVVPKSVLANWAAEAEKWFPGSSVMSIGETYTTDKAGNLKSKSDTAAERNRKLHDIIQNDYDFILISQPAWNELDIDPETKARYLGDDFWVQRGDSMGNAGSKKLNAMREGFDQQMAARDFDKRTNAIYFNDLGVDAVIADEAHAYKNLYAARNRFGQQPKFLGGSGQSNRALDMSFKARWIRDQNDGKNVFGLTATPTKNSPLEIYSMLSHIAPEAFEKIGIRNSEEFLDRFCEFREENILTTAGNIERALVTVGFKNLDELREVMFRYIDRKTAEDVGLILPARDDRQHLVDMTAEQKAVYADLREMAEKAGGKDAEGDAHIFSIMDKMGKAAMDLELYDSGRYAGAHSPKITAAAGQIVAGAADGGQVVFCESVDTHDKIVAALVAAGMDRAHIGIINGAVAKTSAQRQNISDAFNSGKLKVVICNKTAEEGVNLQKGTTDIHHLDLPWEPASMQQRNGRGLRQGNLKESVRIHTYLAKGSFDGYRYQTMRAKKDWQDLLWNGGDRVENLAREGALSRDDLMIMLSADPEAARAEMAKNKEAAQAKFEAAQTEAATADFNRMREMAASLDLLKDKESTAAKRLQVRINRLKDQLGANPFFKAKAALDAKGEFAIQPQSGLLIQPGTPVETAAGKFVAVGVYSAAGDTFVRLRGYASTSTAAKSVSLSSLNDAKTFDYDAKAEEAAIAEVFKAEAATKEFKTYQDLRDIPASVLKDSYASIQKRVKDAAKTYKFSVGHGDTGLIKDGKAVRAMNYEAQRLYDTHDIMLPTPEHREMATQAFMAAERGKKFGTAYDTVRGRTQSRRELQYPDTQYNSKSTNPWATIGNSVFGKEFTAEASERLASEQEARVKTATDLKSAMQEAVATTTGYGVNQRLPNTMLAALYARAEKDGALSAPASNYIPAGWHDAFVPPALHGGYTAPIGDRSLGAVLHRLASQYHPDLAKVIESRVGEPA